MKRRLIPFLAAAAIFSLSAPASATMIDAIDNGRYSATGQYTAGDSQILTGRLFGQEYRSFFVFDLSGISGTVVGAEVTFLGDIGYYDSSDPSETIGLYDVLTPTATLTDTHASGEPAPNDLAPGIFDDLGQGTLYGSGTLAQPSGTIATPAFSVVLNPAALADLNAALGADIALGAALMTWSGAASEYIWGGRALPAASLDLTFAETTSAAVPLPGALPLAAMGLGALALAARRRRGAA